MKIYNKQSKPKLRVRLEFNTFRELESFAKVLDHVAFPTPGTQIPEKTRDFARGILDSLVVACPALKEVEQLMWTDGR